MQPEGGNISSLAQAGGTPTRWEGGLMQVVKAPSQVGKSSALEKLVEKP